jgi:hypothetical protein
VELYTSHWGNKELTDLAAVPIAISRGKPRWRLPYRYRVLGQLAPSREVFGIEDPNRFDEAYRRQLDELGVERVLCELGRIGAQHGGTPLVLLYWEPPEQPCHRRVLARWLEERAGVVALELESGMIPYASPPNQEPLF